jgi:hypothetical protein
MLTESVALSCCGAVLGLVLAVAGTRELAHLHAFNLPLLESVRIDGSALLFTLLTAFAYGVLFGLLPALRVTGLSLREGMQDSSRGSSGGKRHAWVRDGLVVSELAFAYGVRSLPPCFTTDPTAQQDRVNLICLDASCLLCSLRKKTSTVDRRAPGLAGR